MWFDTTRNRGYRKAMAPIAERVIDALFEGLVESPPWTAFLNMLREATTADHAFFYCHPPGGAFGRGIYRMSGEIDAADGEEAFFRDVWSMGPPSAAQFEEGRVYDVLKLINANSDTALSQRLRKNPISALRTMRVTEPTGVEAWLFLSKASGRFPRSADLLLTSLGPVLRGVVQVYVARELERYRAHFDSEAVRRSRMGWLTLDGTGQVIEYDEGFAELLAQSNVLGIAAGGKLAVRSRQSEAIYRTIRAIAADSSAKPQSTTLSNDPWIEVTLQPARRTPVATTTPAIVLMYVHHDIGLSEGGQHRLIEVFNLSPREAELAILLSRGAGTRQAGDSMGLTVHTVRSYLRSIYAKTGATGMPDLVRIVSRSLFVLDA
jgi:DNA-binding CsgD family transcriptional regulator